ncbi:Eaa prophage protein [Escherichia coli]|nr:Eaa prophage protein [Escherichia coli]
MTTITKERIKLFIKNPLDNGLTRGEQMELARIALASLESEPVAWADNEELLDIESIGCGYLLPYPPDKDVDPRRVIPLYRVSSTQIAREAIENAIEYIRSIAFHIDEDDYHGKHIAYFMRQALAWLEGHSCSDDRLGKAENQTVHGNQAAESNRGNEWTGNPDIDNAIIMLDRIDTLESCDDDRIETVKAVLRRLAGNYPVTPDSWVMVPKQVTPEISNAINVVGQRCTCGNCSQRLWDLLLDATQQGG